MLDRIGITLRDEIVTGPSAIIIFLNWIFGFILTDLDLVFTWLESDKWAVLLTVGICIGS